MLERDLERHLSNTSKRLGLTALKLRLMGETGWPDRIVVLPDARVLWIELKLPHGKISPKQAYIHKLLRQLGHTVLVLRTKEEITDALAAASISAKSA